MTRGKYRPRNPGMFFPINFDIIDDLVSKRAGRKVRRLKGASLLAMIAFRDKMRKLA